MKRRLINNIVFVACIVPMLCGFVFAYIRAGWRVGQGYAKAFAAWSSK